MYIKSRLKRNTGPVYESIPAHPDAIYRPQYRPTPVQSLPFDSDIADSRLLANQPMVAAPLTAGSTGFPLGWIIGPILAILTTIILAGLVLAMKKKQNLKRKLKEEEETEKKDAFNVKARSNKTNSPSVENIPLKTIKSNVLSMERHRIIPLASTAKDDESIKITKNDQDSTFLTPIKDRSAVSLTNSNNVSSLSHTELRKSNSPPLKQTRSLSNPRTQSPDHLPLSSTINTTSSLEKTSGKVLKNNPTDWPLSSSHSESAKANIFDQMKEKENPSSNLDTANEVLLKEPPTDTKKTHSSSFSSHRTNNLSQSNWVTSIDVHDHKSDESLIRSNSANHNQGNFSLPHVPVCKTSTSSDDDEYDEIYTIHSTKLSKFQ